MKIFFKTLPLLSALLFVSSCSKDDILEPEPFRPDMENRHRLVRTTDVMEYSTQEFSNLFTQGIPSYILWMYPDIQMSAADISNTLRSYIDLQYLKLYGDFVGEHHFSYSFKRQSFTYRSVRADGDSATFSGSVLYPAPKSGKHTLDGMTLIHNYACTDDNELLSKTYDYLYIRAIYNQALVFCDTEGFGADYGHYAPYFDGYSKGRQHIDAAIAANEVLRKEGIYLKNNAFTENLGISLGGNAALGAQKYLESTECPYWVEEEVLPNFRSFVTDCPTSIDRILDYYSMHDSLTIPCTVPMMISTLFAKQPEVSNEFSFYDFFDEHINDRKLTNSKGKKVGELDAFIQSLLPNDYIFYYFMGYGSNMKKFMNHSLFNEYGEFDESRRQVQLLFNCLEKISIAENWSPKHPILWTSSPNDDVIPFLTSENTYDEFKRNNANVVLIPTRGTHIEATGISMILSYIFERPSTVVNINYFKDTNITDTILNLISLFDN